MNNFTYLALIFLSAGAILSTSLIGLSHFLILVPGLYFLNKTNFKKWPMSAWALLALSVIIILSVLMNQDIAVDGFKPILKVKYYLIAILAIVPIAKFISTDLTDKKLKILINVFLWSATIASVAGMIGLFTGYTPIRFLASCHPTRNCGLFGMYMNYAHGIFLIEIIIIGMIIYRDELMKVINVKWLLFHGVINLIGFYLSYTRGVFIGLLIALPFFIFKKDIKKFFLSLSALLILALVLVSLFPTLKETFLSRSQSNNERIGQWKAAVYAAQERPLLGYGFLNFEKHSQEIKNRYSINRGDPDFKGHAHNNFFQFLGDCGYLGLIAFSLWVGFWIKEIYMQNDLVARVTLPVIVGFIVAGMTQSTFVLANNTLLVTFIYAISIATKYSKDDNAAKVQTNALH